MPSYMVSATENVLRLIGIVTTYQTSDPTTSDVDYNIPTLWINTSTNEGWILTSNDGSTAIWIKMGTQVFGKSFIDFYDATSAPPGSPTSGDNYILDTGTPVDAGWTAVGATNDDFVEWTGSAWAVSTPTVGQISYNETLTDFYIYDGADWVLLSGSISGLTFTTAARAPMTSDNTQAVPTLWINTVLGELWMLADVTAGIAKWLKLSSNTLGDAQDSVLSIAVSTSAPPTETLGDRYILDTSGAPHADWDGASQNDIVHFDGATWVALTPTEGTFCEVEDVDTVYIFITSWVKLFQHTGAIFGTDSGNATADATGTINVVGTSAQGITTSGASNSVTITASDASSTQKGVQENATGAEAVAGSSNTHTVTPFGLESKLGSITLNGVIIGGGANQQLKVTAAMTDGQLVIGSTGNTPVTTVLTPGEGIDITNAAGSITILGEDASTTNKGISELLTDAEAQTGTDTTRSMTAAAFNAAMADYKFSGVVSWSGAGAYYSVSGTDITILRGGTGVIKSKYVTWAGSQSTGSLTKGSTYYIYMDSAGTIGTSTTYSHALHEDYIVLFEALVDNDGTPNVIVVKEDHPVNMPTRTSLYAHDVIGTVIHDGGGVITLKDTDEIQIVGAAELDDHGLCTDIADSGGAAVTQNFVFTDGSGKWVLDSTGTNFLSEYNNAGTMTALSGNKYGVWRLYASKDDKNSATPTYFAVAHTAEFNTIIAARAAINAGVAAQSNELAQLELAQLGYVIYEESSSSIAEVQVAKDTLRSSPTGAGSSNLASLISVVTTNFDGWLSSGDSNVQNALETIDDLAKDGTFHLENTTDGTKQMDFDLSGITTATTRTVTMADQNVDLTPTTGTYQASDAGLTDIAGLAVTDGNIIVGDGANWVAESGATARTSLGLGSADNVTFADITGNTIQAKTKIETDGDNDCDIGDSTNAFKDVYIQGNMYFDNDNSYTQDHYCWVPIASATASGSATLEFTLSSSYDIFLFILESVLPATDNANLQAVLSPNGGSSYHTDYGRSGYYASNSSGTVTSYHSTTQTGMDVSYTVGNDDATRGVCGTFMLINANDATNLARGRALTQHVTGTDNDYIDCSVSTFDRTAAAVNYLKFACTAGNIASGKIIQFGRKFI